jgi:hypothetical protein
MVAELTATAARASIWVVSQARGGDGETVTIASSRTLGLGDGGPLMHDEATSTRVMRDIRIAPRLCPSG